MSREIIVAEGVFSKLTITLNDDVLNKLSVIDKSENPLAAIEDKLRKNLKQFEKEYTKAVNKL